MFIRKLSKFKIQLTVKGSKEIIYCLMILVEDSTSTGPQTANVGSSGAN